MVFRRRAVAEYNGVREFGLIFPDLTDSRSLSWFAIDEVTGRYRETIVPSGAEVRSRTVPDLVLRALPRDQWGEGHKIAIVYRGQVRGNLRAERERAEQADRWAEAERERAAPLARRLRELGIDPDAD